MIVDQAIADVTENGAALHWMRRFEDVQEERDEAKRRAEAADQQVRSLRREVHLLRSTPVANNDRDPMRGDETGAADIGPGENCGEIESRQGRACSRGPSSGALAGKEIG